MSEHLRGRRVAIIGGAGFIGHNLALSLITDGAEVEIVDSLQVNNLLYFASGAGDRALRDLNLRIINERLDLLRQAGVALHPQDARDYHALCRILAAIKPDVIVHLAAVSHAGRSTRIRTAPSTTACERSRMRSITPAMAGCNSSCTCRRAWRMAIFKPNRSVRIIPSIPLVSTER
jgi:NAD(P)-dependent dehydrogenase (short-subunit alcohol dehydrogenase family)